MAKLCTSFYPFLILAVSVLLFFCGLAIRQQRQIRHKQIQGFGYQSTRLLLVMLVIALISMTLFIAYVLGPKAGC